MAKPLAIRRGGHRGLRIETVAAEGYARHAGRTWLLNPRRLEIVLAAATYPGLHLRSASRLLFQPLPSLRFHVRKLAANGLIVSRRLENRIVLFVPGLYPRSVEPFLAVWEDETTPRILRALRSSRRGHVKAGGARMGVDGTALARAFSRLVAFGVIRRASPRSEIFSPTRGWLAFERLCHDGVEDRLAVFLDFLNREDLHPKSEFVRPSLYRITVDGPRSRIRFLVPLDPFTRIDQ